MSAAAGNLALTVKREAIGHVTIDGLKPGEWRRLTTSEIRGFNSPAESYLLTKKAERFFSKNHLKDELEALGIDEDEIPPHLSSSLIYQSYRNGSAADRGDNDLVENDQEEEDEEEGEIREREENGEDERDEDEDDDDEESLMSPPVAFHKMSAPRSKSSSSSSSSSSLKGRQKVNQRKSKNDDDDDDMIYSPV